jgi:diaminopimelate decarboxylase
MGGGAKPFGVDEASTPSLLRKIRGSPVRFVGLHIFCGSQSLSADAIIEAQTRSVQLAFDLARHAAQPMTLLNIGGGFGIPYFPGDRPLDTRAVGENLRELSREVERCLPQCQLCIELGRYLVGEAGVYVCSVIDKKISRGRTFLVTNGGLNHHLAVTGNFGQLIRRNYPVRLLPRTPRAGTEVVSVVGRLCTPLDLLGEAVSLPPAEEGDFVAILQSGAYGLTASPTAFLSHPPPQEILW